MSQFEHGQFLEDLFLTRREFVGRVGNGFAALGLMGLLGESAFASSPTDSLNPLAPKRPPLKARAKRVIFFFMNGGPSQVDTFDPKPMLKNMPAKLSRSTCQQNAKLAPLSHHPTASKSTASPALKSATCSPTWPNTSTTWS